MISFIELWRAHPFNDGGRVDWATSEVPQLSARAMTTALVRAGLTDIDIPFSIPSTLVLAARLDAGRCYGFGPRETLSLALESDLFRAFIGRTGVVLNPAGQQRIDVWNGQRSATMGLARWVQMLTAQQAAPAKALEMWFWPLPDSCGGPDRCSGPDRCDGMELSSGT